QRLDLVDCERWKLSGHDLADQRDCTRADTLRSHENGSGFLAGNEQANSAKIVALSSLRGIDHADHGQRARLPCIAPRAPPNVEIRVRGAVDHFRSFRPGL